MTEQISALVVEVKMYKRRISWSNSSLHQQLSLLIPLPLRLTAVMKNIILFFVFSLCVAKRHKPALPTRVPATSLSISDAAWPSSSLIDEEIRKTKAMLGTKTWFRPCDCGGPGWEKIAFYDFSQQECPHDFTRHYGQYNSISCRPTTTCNRECTCYGRICSSSSLPLPVGGRSYSSVCGRVRGHGRGLAFLNTILCNKNLEQPYVYGASLTRGPAGRRSHIWTFAAAQADGDINPVAACGCSNTNMNWTSATPEDVGNDYFCNSNVQGGITEGRQVIDEDDLWDGKGCVPSSSCCEWNDPPYFCKHLHNTTSEDMELRLFSCHLYDSFSTYYYSSVSVIEIFVK